MFFFLLSLDKTMNLFNTIQICLIAILCLQLAKAQIVNLNGQYHLYELEIEKVSFFKIIFELLIILKIQTSKCTIDR